jgi:site-specific DNA-methyltransferase (adenine-specific)
MTKVDIPSKADFFATLEQASSNSVDSIVMITGSKELISDISITRYLDECIRVLKKGGLLFVQGIPSQLPDMGVYLDKRLIFKYWIAVKSTLYRQTAGFPSVHAGILLFTKNGDRFNINHVRFPHVYCSYCGKPLRDWGGKMHLMNPEGYSISDVWTDLPIEDNYTKLSTPVLNIILKLVGVDQLPRYFSALLGDYTYSEEFQKRVIIGPREGVAIEGQEIVSEPVVQYTLPGFVTTPNYSTPVTTMIEEFWNVVHHGDILEILRQYPDNSIDLVFADPPYNLDKSYNVYNDERRQEVYLNWCNEWLKEYIRILKPTGSLFVLNLPRWAMYHAAFLNQYLYFQNWIVWNALSEPRGKLMPAHYGLLFYTKHPTDFIFNYDQFKDIDSHIYCLRASCIRRRKLSGSDEKEPLTDIWSDIYRIKHRRDRDYHPCQLPDALMERIIRLTTHEGGIVLDALAGTGTSAIVASRLGRRYVAVDVDETYVQIIEEKLTQVSKIGYVKRNSIHRPRPKYNKKALQLELQKIAIELGRLPTPEDVKKMSSYSLEAFQQTFPTWGKALKAAKLEMRDYGNGSA